MKEYILDIIKELCGVCGVSGDEAEVRDRIVSLIDGKCEYYIDNLGNIIGKKGKGGKLFLDAHTDEVGFIVKSIDSDGFIRFEEVGGIDSKLLPDTRVNVNGHTGVICSKPYHLMKGDEGKRVPEISSLAVDIGAKNKEEAEKKVNVGDTFTFERRFILFGEDNDYILSPALDDRVGCAILIALIAKTELDFDFSFSAMEEIGCRGAAVSALSSSADIALAIETTTAADIDGVEEEKRVCALGKGGAVSFMDRSAVYDKDEFDAIMSIAKEKGIPVQMKQAVTGGNDMGAIHKSGEGKKAVAVSVPARYLHSQSVVIRLSDVISAYELIKAYIESK